MLAVRRGSGLDRKSIIIMRVFSFLISIVTSVAAEQYSSQWAVHIEGGNVQADAIAERNGFHNLGEIFPDCYHFEHQRIAKRSISPNHEHHINLMSEPGVKWAKQQRIKSRKKRDFISTRNYDSEQTTVLNDLKWPQMWYLNRGNGLDMSVQGAWNIGITGKGIVVTILDDGLEKNHPDLINNYDPQASYDVNSRDDDPMPRYDLIDSNRHGTRCAGEVAATANNSLCAVGIAFGASVGGVRMLDGDVTDAVEARSLSLNPQHIDIYSASWGPDDDGKTVDGPGELALRAFIEGVTKGRSGKGSIFVWASGNGGRDHDNCNCDGYTNSIWTLSISSATENGLVPWYSEACSSTLATTYSSGSSGEKQVVTTDLHHQCTSGHTGTSASAPLAAGICALALEANNQLTWRDMQHIVVATARPANLKALDWVTNGVGRNVSHSFGYGLMDATAMVQLAKNWRTVPEQHKCEVSAPHINKPIPAKSSVTLKLNVKDCTGVNYLEHIQAKVTLMSQRRGDLQILLTSPAGTKTTLLARRPHDVSRSGFDSWPFMSVHTWGESPFGIWELEVHNEGRYLGRATLHEWALIFYGTETLPGYLPPQSPLRPPYSINLPPLPRKNKASRKNKTANTTSKPNWKSSSKEFKTIQVPIKPIPKVLPTFAPVSGKTPRPSVISARRPTPPPPVAMATTTAFSIAIATPPFGLTIVLAPQLQPSHTPPHLIPAIFQKYPKIQQLFPYSKLYEGPPRPSKKGLQQEDLTDTRKSSGQLIDWQLIFYGTETAPQTSSLNPKAATMIETSSPVTENKKPLGPSTSDDEWKEVSQQTNLSSDIQEDLYENSTHCQHPAKTCLGGGVQQKGGWRVASTMPARECTAGLFLTKEGKCRRKCTDGTYPESPGQCFRCHYSCYTCRGPNDYECASCHGDADLIIVSGVETYCLSKTFANQMDSTKWYYRAWIALGVNLLCLLFMGTYLYLKVRGCKLRKSQPLSSNDSIHYKLANNASDSD